VILDASAILAILLREPGCEGLLRHIAESSVVAAGAPTLVEAALVLSFSRMRNARALRNEFLREADVEIVFLHSRPL
jgi:uncharacterized protein with PIN domain